ncbi:hypothetical protein D9757_009983 [Collybiopsis confluens]|uniref:Uncharacterized protein n=1 Tax=Collybiopsis confluens TaxID=2823264 RepID=A0A8H5LVU8_9AGAR|nr:hypothetical protein D9757_009983 [Collybiopsis confluens]
MSATTIDYIDEGKKLSHGSLYALLSYRGELGAWEWSFLIPNWSVKPVGREGTLFYVKIITSASVNSTSTLSSTNPNPSSHSHYNADAEIKPHWNFSMDTVDILSSAEAVALVRLADIGDLGTYEDIVGENGIRSMFQVVQIPDARLPIPQDFSSRTWFLDVMGNLADCGVCQCEDVWLLEREIRRFAFSAMDKYMQNRGYTVFVAEKSS